VVVERHPLVIAIVDAALTKKLAVAETRPTTGGSRQLSV